MTNLYNSFNDKAKQAIVAENVTYHPAWYPSQSSERSGYIYYDTKTTGNGTSCVVYENFTINIGDRKVRAPMIEDIISFAGTNYYGQYNGSTTNLIFSLDTVSRSIWLINPRSRTYTTNYTIETAGGCFNSYDKTYNGVNALAPVFTVDFDESFSFEIQ